MAQHENSFSGWLHRVRRTGEFSDVTILVGEQEFHLHMLPLLNASIYFRNLPTTGDSPRVVELRDLAGGAQAFSAAADFCYLIKPAYTPDNVAGIRCVAEHLGMAELLDSTKKYLYTHIFSHWRSSMAFLMLYKRLRAPVDDYVESRCIHVIAAVCIKAFSDTKHLSAPFSLSTRGSCNAWQSSPCQILTDMLVMVASLPDRHVDEVIKVLVKADANLNLKCRQGRNVKGWLDALVTVECRSDRASCWVLICLVKLLERSTGSNRPWLELSSQYWCLLLEHVACLKDRVDPLMAEKLQPVMDFLVGRIGGSLHELDDYLHTYRFEPQTLLSLVKHFKDSIEQIEEDGVEEVAMEVDSCVSNFLKASSISVSDFMCFVEAFPPGARRSHDLLYSAVDKLVERSGCSSTDEQQRLWRAVDISKLSVSCKERALNNAAFLCQPHVLENVLHQHSQQLSTASNEDGLQSFGHIIQKVVCASLKLLEENSRCSKELMELQKRYSALSMSPEVACTNKPENMDGYIHAIFPDEMEEAPSSTPARHSTCSSVEC